MEIREELMNRLNGMLEEIEDYRILRLICLIVITLRIALYDLDDAPLRPKKRKRRAPRVKAES